VLSLPDQRTFDLLASAKGRHAAASHIPFKIVFVSADRLSAPLPAPAEQTQRAKAGSKERKRGWKRIDNKIAQRATRAEIRCCHQIERRASVASAVVELP
jgi:hypothetical protein